MYCHGSRCFVHTDRGNVNLHKLTRKEQDAVRTLVSFIALLMLVSCRTTYQFGDDAGGLQAEGAFARMQDRDVTLKLRDGNTYEGSVVRLTDNSLVFVGYSQGAPFNVSLDQVQTISWHGTRIPGLAVGIIVGGVIGAALGGTAEDKKGWLDLVNEQKVGAVI